MHARAHAYLIIATHNRKKNEEKTMAECYNVKLTEYKHTSQIKMYKKPIQIGQKKHLENNKSSSERTQAQIEHSITSSINRTKSKIYAYALANDWQYFCTFTFNPKKVLSADFEECVNAFSKWLQKIHRYNCPAFKYLVVPEYHSDKRKFHFHALMSNINELTFIDSGYKKNGKCIYNLYEYDLGFSTVVPIDTDELSQIKTCSYMLKYITKDLISLSKGKKRYWISRSTIDTPTVSMYALNSDDLEEFRTMSIDNCTYTKTIDVPYTGNVVNIFNV